MGTLVKFGPKVVPYPWLVLMHNILANPTNPLALEAKVDFCYIKVVISSGVACGALWKWQQNPLLVGFTYPKGSLRKCNKIWDRVIFDPFLPKFPPDWTLSRWTINFFPTIGIFLNQL